MVGQWNRWMGPSNGARDQEQEKGGRKGGGVRRERDSRRTSTSFYGATDGIVMTLTPPGSSSSYLDGKLYMFIHLAIAATSRLSSTIVCHGYIILVY